MLAAVAEYGPIALAIGVVGGIGISGVAGIERAAPAPGTFGAFLQDSQTEVQSQVQKAMQNQRETSVVAGLQAEGAIARARGAYKDSLNLKTAEIGEQERGFQRELESVLTSLGSTSNKTVKEAGDRAQFLADRLRVPGTAPQLGSYGPIFLFPSLPFQSVRVRGSFPSSYADATVPQLKVEGKSHKAFDYRSDSLAFSVLTADLGVEEPQEIVWKKAEITVPWSKQVEKFDVELGVLPYSFGRATIDHKIVKVRREEKARTSEEFAVDANEAEPDESRCLTLSAQELSDGWRIGAGTSTAARITGGEGEKKADWLGLALHTQNDNSVCWRARTLRGATVSAMEGAEQAAKVVWRITAKIWRDVNEPGIASESFDLSWGGKHVFPYAAGTWKLRYSKFGGSVTEVESADLSSPLIKVSSDGRGVAISVYPH